MFDLPCLHVTVLAPEGEEDMESTLICADVRAGEGLPVGNQNRRTPKNQPDDLQILNVH